MKSVLIVEDDPFIVRGLRRLLRSRSVDHVVHAATVADAIERLTPPPDWVILDMDLPDGSGLTVLETIRRAGLPIRVIVSTATRDAALMAAVAIYQPELVLPKPLDAASLPL